MMLMLVGCVSLTGHHETPPDAHNKILEKFPDSIPRQQSNVIPPTTEKTLEEVCVSVLQHAN
jgi:hypothetical protein